MNIIDSILQWLSIATQNKTLIAYAAELALPLFSAGGMLLSTSKKSLFRMIGFGCGVSVQPVWFYFAITTYNLGLFVTSMLFTSLWLYRLIPALKKLKEPQPNYKLDSISKEDLGTQKLKYESKPTTLSSTCPKWDSTRLLESVIRMPVKESLLERTIRACYKLEYRIQKIKRVKKKFDNRPLP